MKKNSKPQVAIIMGSDSDLKVMKSAQEALSEFNISSLIKIVSAHRTPDEMYDFAKSAHDKGFKVIIAGAGGAAHLPGMVASLTTLPVIGVPVTQSSLKGLDALLSICQMPKGVPVATVAIDNAYNAGLLAAKILGCHDDSLQKKITSLHAETKVESKKDESEFKKKISLNKKGYNRFLGSLITNWVLGQSSLMDISP